jgi:hypothetical protein
MKDRSTGALVILVLWLCAGTLAYGRPRRPEIDPSMAISGLSLLIGSLAVLRARHKK